MTVEILYNDYLIFGDGANVDYIRKCLPEAEFVFTSIHDVPFFAENEPDLIYMGAMSENNQERAIAALMPYKARFVELIEKGVHVLFTSTSCDVLGKYITHDERKIECLGLFDFTVDRKMLKRFNAMTLGNYNGIEMMGFKSQFGHSYGECEPLFTTARGAGLNPKVSGEGIRRNNFFATYLTGPLLVLNPPFTRHLLTLMGEKEPVLAFEEAAMELYRDRVREFSDPATGIEYH